MSVWRIQKVDAQTRTMAEAAAKAAGVPLGVWLERAILRRVETRPVQEQPPPPPLPVEAIADELKEKPAISSEMQAALDAAERRRRERVGDGGETVRSAPSFAAAPADAELEAAAPDLNDPFATPEKVSEESPFEQPLAADGDTTPPLRIEEDEPIALAGDSDTIDNSDAADVLPTLDEIATAPLAGAKEIEQPVEDAAGAPPPRTGYVPSWENDKDAAVVTTTSRESLGPSPNSVPRRSPSSLPLILGGLFVVAAAAGAAWIFLVETDKAPPVASMATTAPAPTAKPVPAEPPKTAAATPPSAAKPPEPAPAAPAPSSTPPAPAASPVSPPTSVETTAAAAPPLPSTGGPSIVNMALGGTPVAQSAAVAPPAPVSAATAAPNPSPAANEALPTLRTRAEAGDLESQIELGRRYLQGIGVGRNEVEAGKWLLRAAEQGDAQAQFNVGVMYERGVGLEANLPKAIEFYRKSAAQSTPMALHNLGLLYVSGNPGIKADPVQARRLLTQASELGQLESQYSLALMHFQGVGGPVDKVVAMAWMAMAARPNQPQLVDAAKQLAVQLTQPERERAQKLAETFVRTIQTNLQKLQASRGGLQNAAIASTGAKPAAPRVIDRTAIAEMQKLLASLKIYNGAADGAMGPRTAAAIREFQAMAGMPVDGKPSIDLLDNLRDVAGLTVQ